MKRLKTTLEACLALTSHISGSNVAELLDPTTQELSGHWKCDLRAYRCCDSNAAAPPQGDKIKTRVGHLCFDSTLPKAFV